MSWLNIIDMTIFKAMKWWIYSPYTRANCVQAVEQQV